MKADSLESVFFVFVGLLQFVDHCWVAGALLGGVMPLGFGRKTRNNTIQAMTIPTMTKNMSGLEKAGRFSGGGVDDCMGGWMQKMPFDAVFFSGVVKMRFFRGFCQTVVQNCGFWMVKSWWDVW
jgi:hypothetical protein